MSGYMKCSGCGTRRSLDHPWILKRVGTAYCAEECIKRGTRYP